MRIQMNKYLRNIPVGFAEGNGSKLYCICPNCRTEMYCMWRDPIKYTYMGHGGSEWTILLEDSSLKNPREKFRIFSDKWWTENNNLKEFDWWKNKDSDGYILWLLKSMSAADPEKHLHQFNAGLKEIELAAEEKEQFKSMKKCPICHRSLDFPFVDFCVDYSEYEDAIPDFPTENEIRRLEERLAKKHGDKLYGDWLYQTGDLDTDIFRVINYFFQKKDSCRGKSRFDSLYSRINETTVSPIVQADNVKASMDKLKEYIKNLFTLETNIYSLEKRLLELYANQRKSESSVLRRNARTEFKIREQFLAYETEYKDKWEALKILQKSAPTEICGSEFKKPCMPEEPVLQKPGLFNKKKVLAENAILTEKYQKACEEYKHALDQYNRDLDERYAKLINDAECEAEKAKNQFEQSNLNLESQIQAACMIPCPETAFKGMLDAEISQAESLLQSLVECRNGLYACDIVFEKYRNSVALATFYEYLIAGRCIALEGVDGAYNLYEAECRANQIIGQLTKIVDSLEQIKESQFMIYSQLKTINSNLTRLNSTMDGVSKTLKSIKTDVHDMSEYMSIVAQNSNVIAYNSAVTAYYSKMNAELTNSMGFLLALK